jgi:hypothetical protein
MKAAGVLLLAALTAVAVAGDLLVRVDLKSDADIEIAATSGGVFLQRFDGWFLVRVQTKELAALSGGLSCRVLDADIVGKRYVFATTEPGFDRQRLAGCGTVLTEDREGALLCVTGQDVARLNLLPVELCGISTEPRSSLAPRPQPLVPSSVPDSLVWQLMARASQDSAEAVLRRFVLERRPLVSVEADRVRLRHDVPRYVPGRPWAEHNRGEARPAEPEPDTHHLRPRRQYVGNTLQLCARIGRQRVGRRAGA